MFEIFFRSCPKFFLKVVHGVASVSQATATAAISQLQFLFGDPSNFRYVADRTDAVVQSIVTQSSIIRSRHLDDVSSLNELNELVRTICHFLSSVCLSKDHRHLHFLIRRLCLDPV